MGATPDISSAAADDSPLVVDFPVMVYDLYTNWCMCAVGMRKVPPLLEELRRFCAVLPAYVDHTADDALIERILALQQAMETAQTAVKIAEHANDEIMTIFAAMDQGAALHHAMNLAAQHYGHGRA